MHSLLLLFNMRVVQCKIAGYIFKKIILLKWKKAKKFPGILQILIYSSEYPNDLKLKLMELNDLMVGVCFFFHASLLASCTVTKTSTNDPSRQGREMESRLLSVLLSVSVPHNIG